MTYQQAVILLISIISLCNTTSTFLLNSIEEDTTTTVDPKLTCLERNAMALWKLCSYTNQDHPCFWPNEYVKMKVKDVSDIAILASQLCFGRVPQAYLRRSFCCFSDECLKSCYNMVEGIQHY